MDQADGEIQRLAYSSDQVSKSRRIVQQYIKGEATGTGYEFPLTGISANKVEEPEAPVHTTEPSLTDKSELAEDLHKGEVQPISTAEQRRYSVDWDPLQ